MGKKDVYTVEGEERKKEKKKVAQLHSTEKDVNLNGGKIKQSQNNVQAPKVQGVTRGF